MDPNDPNVIAFKKVVEDVDPQAMDRWLRKVIWSEYAPYVCIGLGFVADKSGLQAYVRESKTWCQGIQRGDGWSGSSWSTVCETCSIHQARGGMSLEPGETRRVGRRSDCGATVLDLDGFTAREPEKEIVDEKGDIDWFRRDREARLIVAIEKAEKGLYRSAVKRLATFLERENGGWNRELYGRVHGGSCPCEEIAPDLARLAAIHLIRIIALWARQGSSLSASEAEQAGLAYEYLVSSGDSADLAMAERMLEEVRATIRRWDEAA